jgi:quinol monooxygenase YgiN
MLDLHSPSGHSSGPDGLIDGYSVPIAGSRKTQTTCERRRIMAVYTSGDWHVRPGREQEFVDAWRELAEWSTNEYGPDGWGKLFRDKEDPARFRSLGAWPDERVVEEWRASDGFKQRLAKIRELLEEMSIRTFDLAAEVGRMSAE